jgi:hypothetical protein
MMDIPESVFSKSKEIDIKVAKTNAKKIVNLEEKLVAQKGIKETESRRNEMRKKLFEAQDEVEKKKEQLIERVENRLRQKSSIQTLFIVNWKVI